MCNLQSLECIPFPGPPAEKDPPPPISIYDTVQDVSASDETKIHNKKFLETYTYVCISTLNCKEFTIKNLKNSQGHSFLFLMPTTRKLKCKSKMGTLIKQGIIQFTSFGADKNQKRAIIR